VIPIKIPPHPGTAVKQEACSIVDRMKRSCDSAWVCMADGLEVGFVFMNKKVIQQKILSSTLNCKVLQGRFSLDLLSTTCILS
jgi:hypothetical protein